MRVREWPLRGCTRHRAPGHTAAAEAGGEAREGGPTSETVRSRQGPRPRRRQPRLRGPAGFRLRGLARERADPRPRGPTPPLQPGLLPGCRRDARRLPFRLSGTFYERLPDGGHGTGAPRPWTNVGWVVTRLTGMSHGGARSRDRTGPKDSTKVVLDSGFDRRDHGHTVNSAATRCCCCRHALGRGHAAFGVINF